MQRVEYVRSGDGSARTIGWKFFKNVTSTLSVLLFTALYMRRLTYTSPSVKQRFIQMTEIGSLLKWNCSWKSGKKRFTRMSVKNGSAYEIALWEKSKKQRRSTTVHESRSWKIATLLHHGTERSAYILTGQRNEHPSTEIPGLLTDDPSQAANANCH